MKKLLIGLTLFSLSSYGQQKEGVAYYTEYKDLSFVYDEIDKSFDSVSETNAEVAQIDELKDMLKGILKKEEEVKTQLSFTENLSSYRERDADISEEDVNNNGLNFSSMMPNSDKIYQNLKVKTQVVSRDFQGKSFLIKDSIYSYKWNVTGNQKIISTIPCLEAVHEDSLSKIRVWFTPQIPVSSGPKGLNGLKGLIVEAEMLFKSKEDVEELGNISIKLDRIVFEQPSKTELKEPKKGKVIKGEKAYKELIKEWMKESEGFQNGVTISIGK